MLKEGVHANKEGALLEEEARSLLEELLTPVRDEEFVARQLESDEARMKEAILFDYLVPWGYRIVVPQEDGLCRVAADVF